MSDRHICKAKRKNWNELPKEQWWIEGYYCKKKTGHYTDIGFVEEYKDCIISEFSDGGITWCYIDSSTICHNAGLTDKNGNKIWENDILSRGNLVVIWRESLASFCLSRKGWMYQHFFGEAVDACDCEVIGNIFDNPELLKGGAE